MVCGHIISASDDESCVVWRVQRPQGEHSTSISVQPQSPQRRTPSAAASSSSSSSTNGAGAGAGAAFQPTLYGYADNSEAITAPRDANGVCRVRLLHHNQEVRGGVKVACVAVSPVGGVLATGASDGKVRLWSTVTQHPLGDPTGGLKREL